jgi:hypothetical protein
MLKPASEMSVEELRAEVEKIEAQRAKRRAYSRAHRKAMTPELKAKLQEYNKQRRAHQQEVLARAAQEGVAAAPKPRPRRDKFTWPAGQPQPVEAQGGKQTATAPTTKATAKPSRKK